MEALASGTPVVAFAAGALPEIVDDGVTGFLVSNEHQMADAIRRVDSIDRARCRREAVKRFSSEHMVRNYFGLYTVMTQNSGLPDRPDLTRLPRAAYPC